MNRPDSLAAQLTGAADLLVLLAPSLDKSSLPEALIGAEVRPLTAPVPRPRSRDAVLLAAVDLADLRRASSALSNFGASARIGVWLDRRPPGLSVPTLGPDWPALREIAGSAETGFLLLTFSAPTPARPVLVAFARAASPSGSSSTGWPLLGARRDEPNLWPIDDPAATIAQPRRLFDSSGDSPPDLVIVEQLSDTDGFVNEKHPVLGRTPVLVRSEPELTWDDLGQLGSTEAREALRRRGPISLGAIDDKLFNPISFDRAPVGSPVPLSGGPGGSLRVALPDIGVTVPPSGRLSESDLPHLRTTVGLELDWHGALGPQAYCRAVATLAASGVPLISSHVPEWAADLLAPEVVTALALEPDLNDRLGREEHSVRLRRGALRGHGTSAWRSGLAASRGLQETRQTLVSVLLVTRRPEMVAFALRQVGRQRGVGLEVVLTTHGFVADTRVLDDFVELTGFPVVSLAVESTVPFGDVLNRAAVRAQGDVILKMDDDDWYGPDFVADLLLARDYSGAEVIGCPPEFTFVHPLWLTTRRAGTTELYHRYVAGGTMLIDRAAFRSVGGFRSTLKYVDANLLGAITNSGGRVYRTQGLGYVLRRGSEGHTWDPGLGYFVTRNLAADQWRGFRPSSLLEPQPIDLPRRDPEEREPR